MAILNVSIKHSGKSHELQLDMSKSPLAFKQDIYACTGVPVDRVKVMVKGGVLKDDADWSRLGVKAGQQFMVIGAAGELPKPPEKPIVFLEDMDDATLAIALRMPVGLVNLGNTCYMNATVQCLRAIPELQTALQSYEPQGGGAGQLTAEMGRLYQNMGQTTEKVYPAMFLQRLRTLAPQFAEQRPGLGYSQQDADECLGAILTSLKDGALSVPQAEGAPAKFIERFVMGEMTKELTCDEAPEEEPAISIEQISKIECNISVTTNYMHTGIKDSLDQKIEKQSPTLGRSAVYSQKSRISRLPSNLIVHMVRFYWRRDINKKAKIMRKVKFPFEFDALDLVTDDLKQKILPVNTRLKEIEKERDERRKVRRRIKKPAEASAPSADASIAGVSGSADGPIATVRSPDILPSVGTVVGDSNAMVIDPQPGTDLASEAIIRQRELEELSGLVHESLKADIGSSPTGMYELVGIVTHKGASAESGHYIGFARKDALDTSSGGDPTARYDDPHDEWVKFDDDKVYPITAEKISALDGGGEDSAAYILLYRSKRLD